MSTTLDRIKVLQHKLRAVQWFAHMRSTPDHHGSHASVTGATVSLVLCWQGSPGSKNYHESTEAGLGDILNNALDVDQLLATAEIQLKAEITKLKISREAELKAELAEIEKLKTEDSV